MSYKGLAGVCHDGIEIALVSLWWDFQIGVCDVGNCAVCDDDGGGEEGGSGGGAVERWSGGAGGACGYDGAISSY